MRNTGQTKAVNGFNTRESIITVTVREKGKTLERGGGLVLISDTRLAPKLEAMKEIGGQEAAKKMSGDDTRKQRATVMTSTTEVLKIATDVSAADVSLPTGFKETK